MDIEATLEANAQLAERGKPGMRALHNPAMFAEVVFLLDATVGDSWADASLAQMPTTPCEVIPLVGVELVRAAWRSAGQGQARTESHRPSPRKQPSRADWRRSRPAPRERRAGLQRDVVCCRVCRGLWGSGRSADPPGAGHCRAIDARPTPIDLVMLTQAGQQGQVQALPDAAGLPVTQATPAGHAAAEAQFLRQVFPRNPSLHYKQDAV